MGTSGFTYRDTHCTPKRQTQPELTLKRKWKGGEIDWNFEKWLHAEVALAVEDVARDNDEYYRIISGPFHIVVGLSGE